MQSYSLQQLADEIGATIQGDADVRVSRVSTLAASDGQCVSFLSNSKYRSQLEGCQAAAIILRPDDTHAWQGNALVMDNPYVGFALVAQLLDSTPDAAADIAPSAVIAKDVTLGKNVKIGANAVIESGVTLGDDVQVGHGTVIGKNCSIGEGTKLWANVTLYHGVQMGKHCLVQSGAIIGGDGFGYANDKGRWIKIPQLGGVIIGDNVEIGASTTIDRGALEDTRLGDGCIIDNQVQIAHNVVLGKHVAVAGCSVFAGSTTVGDYCTFGGLSGINGHLEICANAHFTGMSMVINNVNEPGQYSSGMPVVPNRDWRKNAVQLRRLSQLNERVKRLEKAQKD